MKNSSWSPQKRSRQRFPPLCTGLGSCSQRPGWAWACPPIAKQLIKRRANGRPVVAGATSRQVAPTSYKQRIQQKAVHLPPPPGPAASLCKPVLRRDGRASLAGPGLGWFSSPLGCLAGIRETVSVLLRMRLQYCHGQQRSRRRLCLPNRTYAHGPCSRMHVPPTRLQVGGYLAGAIGHSAADDMDSHHMPQGRRGLEALGRKEPSEEVLPWLLHAARAPHSQTAGASSGTCHPRAGRRGRRERCRCSSLTRAQARRRRPNEA